MSERVWADVDAYVERHLIEDDPVLERALRDSAAAGLPTIAVTPAQGKLLWLLARIHGARRILELGTLGGYSTIWLARALAGQGSLVTLELKAEYAAVASTNLERAGLRGRVEIMVGPALASLQELVAASGEPFDMVFVDADKESTPLYMPLILELVAPGALIVVDNVVRAGALADPGTESAHVRGMQRLHEMLAADPSVSATTIQTVGAKGYDGFTILLVEDDAGGAAGR